MFGGHPMVLKEAAGSEWSCSKNAHPANFFATNQRAQTKIQTATPYCKQGTDKLSGGKSKKDGLLIIPDFLWYFLLLYCFTPFTALQTYIFLDDPVAHPHSSYQTQKVKNELGLHNLYYYTAVTAETLGRLLAEKPP